MYRMPGSRYRKRRGGQPRRYRLLAHLVTSASVLAILTGLSHYELSVHMTAAGIVDATLTKITGTDYGNEGGTGDRTALIDCSGSVPVQAGALVYGDWANLIDGATGSSSGDSIQFTNANSDPGEIVFDFRKSGFARVIDEFRWKQSSVVGLGNWVIEAWDGQETWTLLKSSFALGTATTQLISFDNSHAYFIYRMRHVSGARSNVPWCHECEFKIAIGPPLPASSTSYSGEDGSGNRTGTITVTTTATISAGSISVLVNGVTSGVFEPSFTGGQTLREIKFDFATPRLIDEFKWYQGNTANHGFWQFFGSNDDTTYSSIGTWFTFDGLLFGAPKTYAHMANNRTAYRYYKLRQLSGTTSNSPTLYEIDFKIGVGGILPEVTELTAHMETSGQAIIVLRINDDPGPEFEWTEGAKDFVTSVPSPASFGMYWGSIFFPNLSPNRFTRFPTSGWILHGSTGNVLKFVFDTPRVMNGFRWFQSWYPVPTPGPDGFPLGDGTQGVWQFYGSNDDDDYTALGNPFTLRSMPLTGPAQTLHIPGSGPGDPGTDVTVYPTFGEFNEPYGNTDAYQYYELRQLSGSCKQYAYAAGGYGYYPLNLQGCDFRLLEP